MSFIGERTVVIDDGTIYIGVHDGWNDEGDGRLLVAIDEIAGDLDNTFVPLFDGFWGVSDIATSEQGLGCDDLRGCPGFGGLG